MAPGTAAAKNDWGFRAMRNPFYGYGTIRRGEAFVGRSRDVSRLLDYLASRSGSLSVVGEHRVGKSSLTWEVVERVVQSDSRLAFAWLDLSVVLDPVCAFRAILRELAEHLQGGEFEIPPTLDNALAHEARDGYQAYEICRRGLVGLRKAGFDSLVVLDEFDAVRRLNDSSGFVHRLRALIDARHMTGLSIVFISRRSLIAIENQLSGVSNLDGVCEKHFVGPLDDAGINEMLARCGGAWDVSVEDKDLLRWYTGGHPYLAEMILCHGWDDRSVPAGVDASLSAILDHYRHLCNLLEEDGLFEQLLRATVGPRWKLSLDAVERLTQYGIMRRLSTPEGQRFQGWSEHFHAYLEKCAREQPFLEVWRETENALRDLIQSVCTRELGSNWQNVLQQRHKNLESVLNGCRLRMEKEQRHFGLSASDRILEYSYPMDLGAIIFSEWQHFRNILGNEKKYWNDRFVLLSKVRNPSAHFREYVVPEHEMITAQGYCKELLDLIR